MSETLRSALRRLLVDDYHGLKERLGRRFGSFDFASEILHEAWLRLQRSDANLSVAEVQNQRAYLYRIVLNVATDRQRAEKWFQKYDTMPAELKLALTRKTADIPVDIDPVFSFKRSVK